MSSKLFRKISYFVLYDKNDIPVCYFDNFEELSKYINYRCSDLVIKFNKFGDSIKIVIGNQFYKLYRFQD